MQNQLDCTINLDEDIAKIMQGLPEKDKIEQMMKEAKEQMGIEDEEAQREKRTASFVVNSSDDEKDDEYDNEEDDEDIEKEVVVDTNVGISPILRKEDQSSEQLKEFSPGLQITSTPLRKVGSFQFGQDDYKEKLLKQVEKTLLMSKYYLIQKQVNTVLSDKCAGIKETTDDTKVEIDQIKKKYQAKKKEYEKEKFKKELFQEKSNKLQEQLK